MPIACIAAGHHNLQSGNETERRLVGELAEAYGRAFVAAGFVTHVLTPDGPDADQAPGDGEFPGDIAAVARRAVALGAQLFIELHTEAGPRGVFVIYPDWPSRGDLDADVRDRLGPALATAISQTSAGIPVRGNGVMSERQTAVGASGHRLAAFAATAGARATMTRCLIEHGAHTQPADLAILERPEARQAMADAAARVCASFYGLAPAVPGPPAPPAYRVGAGILAAMAARKDSPIGHEQYIHERINGADIISVAPGRLGMYTYHPAAGRVAFTAWEG